MDFTQKSSSNPNTNGVWRVEFHLGRLGLGNLRNEAIGDRLGVLLDSAGRSLMSLFSPIEERQLVTPEGIEEELAAVAQTPWSKKMSEQVKEVHTLLAKGGVWSLLQVARSFSKAKATDAEDVLDSLQALGVVLTQGEDKEQRWAITG